MIVFWLKPVKAAKDMMPEAKLEVPYDGAKGMLMVDGVDNRMFLKELIERMYNDLPTPKSKKTEAEHLNEKKTACASLITKEDGMAWR